MSTVMIFFLVWSVLVNVWIFFKFGNASEVTVYLVKTLSLLAAAFSIYQLFKLV